MFEPGPTVGDICGIYNHEDWMRDALKRQNLCARCYPIMADVECLRQATSTKGFDLQVPLRILHDSAESGSCRLCSIFLCIALHSLLDEGFFGWPMAKFLDVHEAAVASLKAKALIQPRKRKSFCDIHELLIYGGIIGVGIPVRDLTDSHLRFKIFASPGDRAANFVNSLECDRDMHSDAAFSQIQLWAMTCDIHHSSCPRPAPRPLPTRVLDVSNRDNADANDLRLHVTKGEWGQYTALSYCWGDGQQIKTTLSSLGNAYAHIAMSSLPLTIQDAVIVTRQIGFKYLWVDALCIIQDSIEDKEAEIGRMAQIYMNSSLTICAASASSCDDGFLAPKPSPRSLEPDCVSYQFQLPIACPDGAAHIFGVEYCIWDNGFSPEPLDHRAWAYQEQILSRRSLTYGMSTLTWQCENSVQTWNSWLRKHQKMMTRVRLPKFGGRNLYKGTWKCLVALYGRRNLTFPDDCLPAISALASTILRLTKEDGGDPGMYLAGIWENDALDQLIWFADPGESREVRCIPYRAPSWSWASVGCPILFPDPRNGLTLSELESSKGMELEMIDCNVTPRSGVVPLGQVTSGQLRVRGCLIHGTSVPDPESWLLGTFKGSKSDVVLKLDCHSVDDRAAILKAQSCWWLRIQHRHGLILELINGDIYRRIGCVVFNKWPGSSIDRRVVDVI